VGLTLSGSINVGATTYSPLHDVTQFTLIQAQANGVAPIWRANGAPGNPVVIANGTDPNPQTRGAVTSISLQLGQSAVSNQGIDLSNLLATITTLIQPLLGLVNGLVANAINPLLSALGIQVGTVVTTMDTVTIGQPVIVSTNLP